jgi:hypothetical protein
LNNKDIILFCKEDMRGGVKPPPRGAAKKTTERPGLTAD